MKKFFTVIIAMLCCFMFFTDTVNSLAQTTINVQAERVLSVSENVAGETNNATESPEEKENETLWDYIKSIPLPALIILILIALRVFGPWILYLIGSKGGDTGGCETGSCSVGCGCSTSGGCSGGVDCSGV